jgi:putative flippase GtrA
MTTAPIYDEERSMYSYHLLYLLRTSVSNIFRGRPRGWSIEIARSTIAAGIAAVVDYGILIPLVEFAAVSAVTASAAGVVAGQITSYLVHTLWIFPSGDHGYHGTQLVVFLTIGAISLGTHTFSMVVLTSALDFHYLLAKVISVLLMFSLGFLLRRLSHRYLTLRGEGTEG